MELRDRTGFVSQEDIVLPMLTVQDHVLHSARLRLPDDQPDALKCKRTKQVLNLLGLSYAANKQIGDELDRGVSTMIHLSLERE